MHPEVYFSPLKSVRGMSQMDKISSLLEHAGFDKYYGRNDITAVKVHFGELGNTAYIRPIFLRPILEKLRSVGANPYLTDTNTLYVGMRTNSVDHLHNAALNGFNYSTLQVPIIIADGMRGELSSHIDVPDGELLKQAEFASEILNSDKLFVVSHFKGHELTSFGGAIKNISMGCAPRGGKMEMHSASRPKVKSKRCTACGKCLPSCQVRAISMRDKKAFIDPNVCVGCSRCIAFCPEGAILVPWDEAAGSTVKKMVEYASALHNYFDGKIVYINFLTNMSPDCDCVPANDAPITHDIGYLASSDPVAIDKASWDLISKQMGTDNPIEGHHPHLNPETLFEHAEKINFGSTAYRLVEID